MHALFAPAAAPEIGGGHVMRGLALAQALQAAGVSCSFAVPPWGGRLVERFAGAQPPGLYVLERSGDPAAIATALEALAPDVLVLDDFTLDAAATAPLARPGLTRVVIDDLADRSYACELLADPSFGREPSAYDGLVPLGCELLVGPAHALLRPGFAEAPSRPPVDTRVQRVFVSFGLSDVGAIAARAVERLRPLAPDAEIDVALASDAASLPRLRAMAERDTRVTLHVDTREVADLMRAADVAVGAGGSATWERFALGLPTLAVVVADNQRPMIGRLADAGLLLAVDMAEPGFDAALEEGFRRLRQPDVRRRFSTASRAICDGRGAARVAQAVLRRARA